MAITKKSPPKRCEPDKQDLFWVALACSEALERHETWTMCIGGGQGAAGIFERV